MSRKSLKNVISLIESANKDVPVEEQFLTDLKRSIEMSDVKNARKPSLSYKPSSMNCIRAMYYGVTGVDFTPDSNYIMVGICETGTDRHERIQNAIADMTNNGIDCTYVDVGDYVKSRGLDSYLDIVEKQGNETKLFDRNRKISFLCDGIIKYKGKYYIVEFKTESGFKWVNRKGVDPKHYNQARTYSLELQIENVLFVYISRDNVDMKSYMYHVTESERDTIKELIELCDSYVEKHETPPKPADADNKKCAYCNWREQCRKEE